MVYSKTGQITMFVIVGLLSIVTIALVLFLFNDTKIAPMESQKTKTQDITTMSSPVTNFVHSCITNTGKEDILFIANQGGYYEFPKDVEQYLTVPYYMKQNVKMVPPVYVVEEQLSQYMDEQLFFCLQNFAAFESIHVEQGDTKTKTEITSTSVRFEVNLPLRVQEDVLEKYYDTFSIELPSSLGTLHASSLTFVNAEEQDALCISCLTTLAINHGFRAVVSPVENNVVSFSLIDEQSNLEYNFLSEYRFEEKE